MRFYILLIIAYVIAISVNANITENHGKIDGFGPCSDNLASLTKQFASATKAVNDALDHKSIATNLSAAFDELQNSLLTVSTNCCQNFFFYSKTEENAAAIVASGSPMVDEFSNLVLAVISKKPIIEKDNESLKTTRNMLRNIIFSLNGFIRCFSKTDQAWRDKYKKAITDCKSAFSLRQK